MSSETISNSPRTRKFLGILANASISMLYVMLGSLIASVLLNVNGDTGRARVALAVAGVCALFALIVFFVLELTLDDDDEYGPTS